MLSYQFLVEHGIIVPEPSPSCCFPAIDFSIYMKVQTGVFGFDDHQKAVPRIDQLVEKKTTTSIALKLFAVFCSFFAFYVFLG